MDKKPILTVATIWTKTSEYLGKCISDVIGHLIDVRTFSEEESPVLDYEPDLILTTGPYSRRLIEDFFPGRPCVEGSRRLSNNNLDQVLAIPSGTVVLVVSYPIAAAHETISLLKQAKINHIQYECYEPFSTIDPTKYRYVITQGMMTFCPYEFENVIDLGQKTLSISSFMKILEFFGLDTAYADVFENNNFAAQMSMCKKVTDYTFAMERQNQVQSFFLNETSDGMIFLDEHRRLVFANESARNMFKSTADIVNDPEFVRISEQLDRENMFNVSGDVFQTPDIVAQIGVGNMLCRKNEVSSKLGTQTYYTLRRADSIRKHETMLRRQTYSKSFKSKYRFDDIWGSSSKRIRMKMLAKTFAPTDQTILIVGESGTGKELLAQSIHAASKRANEPFVGINLASMSQSLIESELFGYEEGSFTGAKKGGKAGLLEVANNGTVFLDEIGDAPLPIQIMLLRVLEERALVRVGGTQSIPINVRVIAATNRPLSTMVKEGTFRKDLYYRLNVLSIQTVPLRETPDEIISYLQRYGLEQFNKEYRFTDYAHRILVDYPWPGNYRELKNVAEYLYYLNPEKKVYSDADLPDYILEEMCGDDTSVLSSHMQEHVFEKEPLLVDVLKLFYAPEDGRTSRTALVKALNSQGVPVTEAQMKRLLNTLKEQKLIQIGSTKQGSRITELGRDVVESFLDS